MFFAVSRGAYRQFTFNLRAVHIDTVLIFIRFYFVFFLVTYVYSYDWTVKLDAEIGGEDKAWAKIFFIISCELASKKLWNKIVGEGWGWPGV